MGKKESILNRIKTVKKDQWLIVILVGILLVIIAIPTKPKSSKNSDNSENSKSSVNAKPEAGGETEQGNNYQDYLESRLEEILGRMDGVGKVQVMITLSDGGTQVLQQDEKANHTQTEETDGGSNRTAMQNESEYTTVFVEEDGKKVPYIVQTKTPQVDGVIVVCEGGQTQSVIQNISKAIGALFSVESHKIMVMKMK